MSMLTHGEGTAHDNLSYAFVHNAALTLIKTFFLERLLHAGPRFHPRLEGQQMRHGRKIQMHGPGPAQDHEKPKIHETAAHNDFCESYCWDENGIPSTDRFMARLRKQSDRF